MKKILCLFLCLLFAAGLLPGCSTVAAPNGSMPETAPTGTAAPAPVSLSVGFGRGDITPRQPVPLDGLTSKEDRVSTGVNEPIYTTCIAFTDGNGNTFLLIIVDLLYVYLPMAEARAEISKSTGIPVSNIWLATTHNHSGPALDIESAATEAAGELLRQQIVAAANDALADRKPAGMHITDTHPVNLNFVRHYIMDDGSYAGDNFGDTQGKQYVSHVSDVDNQLQLVKFTREGGKDVILMNWQGHPTGHSGNDRYRILSGVTVATNKLEEELDCHAAYILGASGNVNNSTRIASERVTSDYVNHYKTLAQHAIDASATFREVNIGNIQFASENCPCPLKSGSSGTMDIPVGAVSIGDVAFVFASYEMFDTNGKFVKDNSPFEMTFVSSCTNGYNHYIPSAPTFEYGGYEVGKSMVGAGSGEKLADSMVSLLNQLHTAE